MLGSIYPISRSVFGSPEDLAHPAYANMINAIQDVVNGHPHVIFAAGHEHNLQYIKDSNYHYIVSGAGCKHSRVEKGRNAKFLTSTLGFATLEISSSKNVKLNFYVTAADSFGRAYSENILNFSSLPKPQDTIPQTVAVYEYRDSVLAPASLLYKKPSGFKRFMLGENYRKEWSTPVMLKEFNIKKEKGGFTIEGRGGGKQTKSLALKDKDGNEWALRTIDKDPTLAMPSNFRNSVARDFVQDMISAAHPYAPLVAELAKAEKVRQATPEFFYVPDDPAFGYYRELFANKVCMLERKEPVPRGIETKSTLKVINEWWRIMNT